MRTVTGRLMGRKNLPITALVQSGSSGASKRSILLSGRWASAASSFVCFLDGFFVGGLRGQIGEIEIVVKGLF